MAVVAMVVQESAESTVSVSGSRTSLERVIHWTFALKTSVTGKARPK
jgi:hypothetical protein